MGWVNLAAQSSDSAYHSGTETVLARTLLFCVGLFFTFLMSRSTEFSFKVSPRLRELVAAYGFQRTLYREGEIIVN